MLKQDFTTKLLNLEDVIITNVKNVEKTLHVSLELPRKNHTCPCCGEITDRIHDYRLQTIKDKPLGRTTYLHLRKRRYVCNACGKRFYEKNDFLPRYYRMTSRMIAAIIAEFRKLASASQIAKEFNISATTAVRCFDYVSYQCKQLPEVLSIDEFKGNAGGEKYQSIITDPQNRTILDILPNRLENDLIHYFRSFSNRDSVKYFVTDMNPHFRSVAKSCFPKAQIIADRYHVSRLVIWAMENVRKNEQKRFSARFQKYFKRSRSLLTKSQNKLTNTELNALALMLEISPRLAMAYRLKNQFLRVMHAPDSIEGSSRLCDWLLLAESQLDYLPEFNSCTNAYHNWSQEILNALDVHWSNGFTEGCNNKTKVLKRVCFGFRNFSRFRNRILHCAS